MDETKDQNKRKTVSQILNEIADQICTEYCRFPFEIDNEDELYERCQRCPLVEKL